MTEDQVEETLLNVLSDLLSLVDSHIMEVVSDLKQTSLILDEAVVKLDQSFHGIHREFDETPLCPSDILSNIDTLKLLTPHLNEMIIALQFHDLTTQLLQRASTRLHGLRDILLATHHKAGIKNDKDLSNQLVDVEQTLQELSEQLHISLSKSLRQEHMGSGDVELF